MPIQFPDNPSVNETHSVNGRTYIWTGQKWRRRRPRIEYVPPTMEVVNDFTAGSALKVDADTSSVGIGTMTPNAGDALTVGGDTTVDGHINVYSSLTVGASAGFSGDVDVSGNLVVDGYITVPTQVAGTNDTKVATTEYVTNAIAGLVGGAPAALDTLNELAAALDNDASYATSITNALSLKLDSSSYTAADVLAKIKTVDGASSGLDADTLDGSHASAFAASSHTHSYAASSHTHSYVPTSGGTVTGNFTTQGNLYVGKNGGGDSYIYFYDDNSNAWREFFWDDSENRFRTSHAFKTSSYLHAATELYVGDNSGGDSWIWLYDDNSNAWRVFGWDDSQNAYWFNGGTVIANDRIKSNQRYEGIYGVNGGVGPGRGPAAGLNTAGGNAFWTHWDGLMKLYIDATYIKNFVIDHPDDPENQWLIHACSEGPTADVFYRGEGQLENGIAIIELPSYFESIAEEEGRTVMITPIANANGMIANLAAYEVVNGRFVVEQVGGYNVPDQKFWWRVDAVRRNTSFPVEPNKADVTIGGSGPYRFIQEMRT